MIRIACICVLLCASTLAIAQTLSPDQQIYERFREWVTRQPPQQPSPGSSQPDELTQYRNVLRSQGVSEGEVDRQIRIIDEQGRRLEVERWNQILTNPKPTFNTNPNEFLVRVSRARKAGTALDVGMGQGRNAIYLAQNGWTVTGFDPAGRAVAAALDEAKRLGVRIDAQVKDDEEFDWGTARWDLIVLSYVGGRNLVTRVVTSLRPGGVVVVEAFHRDATKNASIGGGVVFDSNELLHLFDGLRVIQYEDAEAVGDFGGRMTRVVRLAAEKP